MELQEKTKGGYFHVIAGGKEISKHRSFSAAKKHADANQGSAVYSDEGIQVYPEDSRDIEPTVPEPEQKTINAILKAKMNVRKGPSLKAEIIRTLPAGETVEVTEVIDASENNDSWMRVRDGNDNAYILYSGGKYAELQK